MEGEEEGEGEEDLRTRVRHMRGELKQVKELLLEREGR